jgi:hypothetical protein
MTRIEIRDGIDKGALTVDLKDILSVIGEEGASFEWRIEHIEAVASPQSGLDILRLEREVRNAFGGFRISWSELNRLAGLIYQTINCRVVTNGMLSIEVEDSGRWILTAEEESILKRCHERFRSISEL